MTKRQPERKSYWMGAIGPKDDFGAEIKDTFIDGKTRMGPWGIMTMESWQQHGVGRLGLGFGQRYKKEQADGKVRWLKVEG